METVQGLVVDGSAESGSYSLPVALAFDDARGTRHTDSQLISLLVREQPHFRIDFYRPVGEPIVDEPFTLPVEVTNIGRTLVNVNSLELTSEELEIQDGSLYLGPLDAGTSGSLEATGIAYEGGTAEIVVNVHYLDDFDQARVMTKTLVVEVEEPREPAPEAEQASTEQEAGFWRRLLRILRGLVGLGS
jgi:hypothetical protein